ncbi:MAG: TIGR02996 domain-containing protein [Planctomycetia bacterium]|nr:TIGR02996 domain-containing protein [Planctomycetia bacterium]
MTEKTAFLQAIAEQPADRTARLVFADFLEETGEPIEVARAEFIRAQVESEVVHPNSNRHAELTQRAGELFRAHWLDWWSPVCSAVGLPPPHQPSTGVRGWLARRFRNLRTPPAEPGHPYSLSRERGSFISIASGEPDPLNALRSVEFAGGFPESLSFLGQLAHSAEFIHRWSEASPLAALDLHGIVARDWRNIDGPHLCGLRRLNLSGGARTGVEAVARSNHLDQLEELWLDSDRSNIHWPEELYRTFADSGLAQRVKRLHLEIARYPEAQALGSTSLEHLTALEITTPSTVTYPDEIMLARSSVMDLLSSLNLRQLESLALRRHASSLSAFMNWPQIERLQRLHLDFDALAFTEAHIPSQRFFPSLTDLSLSAREWTAFSLAALAEWSAISRLCHLRISGLSMRDPESVAGAMRLVQALNPDRLETLRVDSPAFSTRVVRSALTERFGDRVRFG